ncbi:MAG TPA: triose-phosphate isomerase [Gemmatimonadales bacterium]|jgi:triosephosphate isomerase|nr:triose-phosphate isomerase [Gemmatimonadales bacterium]
MNRRRIFAANWKMHHGPTSARAFLERFLPIMPPAPGCALWFFTPGPSIEAVATAVHQRSDISAGAQNVHWEPKGAYTGEISVEIAKDAGARGALVGHSERRHVFGESDEATGLKVRALLDGGLAAMLCVGETLEEREAGKTEAVCLRQLAAGLAEVNAEELDQVLIAYEPVWAIGTGRNATPADAAAVHRALRAELRRMGAAAPAVLYGGSVNLGNVQELMAQQEIDGVLVGGASLDPVKWAELVASGSTG